MLSVVVITEFASVPTAGPRSRSGSGRRSGAFAPEKIRAAKPEGICVAGLAGVIGIGIWLSGALKPGSPPVTSGNCPCANGLGGT